MISSIANTLTCPFVARKCQAEKCMAWHKVESPWKTEGCKFINCITEITFAYIKSIINNNPISKNES